MRAISDFTAAAERIHLDIAPRLSAMYYDLEKAQELHREADKKARELFTGSSDIKKKKQKTRSRATTIPPHIRRAIALDPFMFACIYTWFDQKHVCEGRVEWEHPWLYRGKKIQERWALVPICYGFHRGSGLNKEIGRLVSLLRMTMDDRAVVGHKYPLFVGESQILRSYLEKKYPHIPKAYKALGL